MRECVDMVLTWRSCKHDGEEVDAHSDSIEDREGSEAVGDGVILRRGVCETCLGHKQNYLAS